MKTNEDLVEKFIKQAKTQIKVTPPVSSRKKRLLLGMIISMSVAAIYSSVAELIKIVQVPGIPLYFQPFGTIGNVLYTMLLAGLASLAAIWGEKSTSGMVFGGFIIFIGIEVEKFLSLALFSSLFLLTPLGLFALAFIALELLLLTLMVGLLRWAVDVQLEKPHLKFWHWQRSAAILTLVGIAFVLGYFHKMPVEWIISLKAANSLVQAGLGAKSFSEFPEGLNEKHMEDFSTYASHNYKLEVNNSLQGLFYDAYPSLEIEFRDNIVIIYFESEQDIACLISIAGTNKCLPINRKIKLVPIFF